MNRTRTLTPTQTKRALRLARTAFEQIANVTHTDWIPELYQRATEDGMTPLAGHCALVTSTLYFTFGGCLVPALIRYPSGVATPHNWNFLPDLGHVDLTSDQFEGGDGATPPFHLPMYFSRLAPDLPPRVYRIADRWDRWVKELEENPSWQLLRRRYPHLPRLPRSVGLMLRDELADIEDEEQTIILTDDLPF